MKVESLKNKKDFDRVFSGKKSFGNRHFTLLYAPNGLEISRLGIIVSKKISKRAVVRNKLRRQVRETFCMNMDMIAGGYDLIIIPKACCTREPYSVLEKSFQHLFYKTGLKQTGGRA